jgi:hypothetical protein
MLIAPVMGDDEDRDEDDSYSNESVVVDEWVASSDDEDDDVVVEVEIEIGQVYERGEPSASSTGTGPVMLVA